MAGHDRDYYRRRASEEAARAAEATDPRVAAVHLEIAAAYHWRATSGDALPTGPAAMHRPSPAASATMMTLT